MEIEDMKAENEKIEKIRKGERKLKTLFMSKSTGS